MNELATVDQRQTSLADTSCFDSIAVFKDTMEMARCLAQSCFVPSAFKNNPASCLVAIDLARRLRVSPLTILPHLYVIDNKPAFSAQFLITLVNRSGKFNRLDWETGADGKARVHFSRWNAAKKEAEIYEEDVPNCYAVAKLVERSTGKEYKSPRVDMAFADMNGWTAKNGSKWRTMPEIMAAYRSASILIKRVCPELTLGLDFAEDVQDAVVDVPDYRRDVVLDADAVAPPAADAAAEVVDLVAVYRQKIADAETAAQLEALGQEIARAGLTGEARDSVAESYTQRKTELAAAADVQAISDRIAAAASKKELEKIYAELDGAPLPQAITTELAHAIDARAAELEAKK